MQGDGETGRVFEKGSGKSRRGWGKAGEQRLAKREKKSDWWRAGTGGNRGVPRTQKE
jgi:hypothetical protein